MSSSGTTPSTRKEVISGRALALIALLFVIGFLIYSEAMKGPFLYDDDAYLLKNALIYRLDNFLVLPFNRYVTFLSFAVNYAISGLIPFDFHAVNVFIHVVNSVLVYAFVIRIFRTPRMGGHERTSSNGKAHSIAAMAALIFVSHPMQTQAVSYITQRFASLATLFYLLAVVLYLDYRLHETGAPQWRRFPPYCLSLFFAVVAQFTKEISYTVPAIVVLLEVVFFDARTEVGGVRKRLLRLLPFVAIFAVLPFIFLTASWIDSSAGAANIVRNLQVAELVSLSSYDYLMTQFMVVVMYLRLLVWPAGQRLLYEIPLYTSFFIPSVLMSFVFLASIFSIGVYLCFACRSVSASLRPLIGFGILWFFITISVESSIVPIRHLIFEHRVYLSSAGAFMAVSAFIYLLLNYLHSRLNRNEWMPRIWRLLIFVIVSALSITAYNRNMVWTDRLVFWKEVVAKAPKTAHAYQNLGSVYFDRGKHEEAIDNFKKAIELMPDGPKGYTAMAGALAMLGRLDEAEDACLTAIELSPDGYEGYVNLGAVFLLRNDYEAAMVNLEKALAIEPNEVAAIRDMAIILEKTGRLDEAIERYKEALRIAPHKLEFYTAIGDLLMRKGLNEEAGVYLKEAERLKSRY
ncbi:MAG: tetratricopeptide repeat protein [Deltaproteobacteria bacterium]|nr:tetratricopeptide repeat protein [Deltaproteobacteria bacterium]